VQWEEEDARRRKTTQQQPAEKDLPNKPLAKKSKTSSPSVSSSPTSGGDSLSSSPLPFDSSVQAPRLAAMVMEHTFDALRKQAWQSGGKASSSSSLMMRTLSSIPRLLQLLRKYPSSAATFAELTRSFVEVADPWPFLRWSSQMLALMDREVEGNALAPLLERMAERYPQALRYSFRISMESLVGGDGDAGDDGNKTSTSRSLVLKAMAQRTSRLSSLLHDPTTSAFVEALHGLQHPELWLKDGLRAMRLLLQSPEGKALASASPSELAAKLKALYLPVFDRVADDSSASKQLVGGRSGVGSHNRDFAAKWKRDLEAHFGRQGSKITPTNFKGVKKGLADLSEKVNKALQTVKAGKQQLSLFSEWLCEFDGSRSARREHALEVPGQYWWPDSKPNPTLHARISTMESEVLTMGSLRKPKRLTILGDDEQEHNFLVKGGEDLRNDERIEQLLTLMNGILASKEHGAASAASLGVRTYSVVPMTTQVGLLQWVNHTSPIKSVISDGLKTDAAFHARNQALLTGKIPSLAGEGEGGGTKRHRGGGEASSFSSSSSAMFATGSHSFPDVNLLDPKSFAPLKEFYSKVLEGKGTGPDSFHRMYGSVPASKVVPFFETVSQVLPFDVLRRQLMTMAPGPEVFLTFRNEFARSLAVFSMAGYLLGIGDRHLDNFLIDTRSGQVVPIDFGMAFGMATSVLPVPELIPFRLTPQFSAILRPLDSLGLLKRHATLAMSAFAAEASVLVRTMDVFLQDPIVDWLESCASKRPPDDEDDDDDDGGGGGKAEAQAAPVWEPTRRIRNAKKKLCGRNPMDIMIDDLRQNAQVQKLKTLPALEAILRGQAAGNSVPLRMNKKAPAGRRAMEDGDGGGAAGNNLLQAHTLAVANQVECLIDMATDPNILGRQWLGLQTWI